MSNTVPTRVVLYAHITGEPRAAAEFRWSEGSEVSLTVLDPEWGALAEEFYANGVPVRTEQRLVTRSDAPAFMRALLEPLNATYYGFVDESESNATTSDQEHP
jgi:hypothetical protein